MKKARPALAFAVVALAACSPRTIALRETTSLMAGGESALYEEPDPQLARESFGAQLKLGEVLLRDDPSNARLLGMLAEGFNGYAFLFFDESEPARAKGYYLRGRDYALRLLARRRGLDDVAKLNDDALTKALAFAKPDDAPALFWAAFGWAGYINLSKDDPSALAELPKAAALMQRAQQLDPNYHFAGPDLFFGVYYASRPALLGGDVKKAQAAFEDARKRTGGKYLMTYVLEARYLAVAKQDQETFTRLLNKVLSSPSGELPDARLTDEVAKNKARTLLEKKDDLF